jgi:hypothetical protein
VPGEQREGCDLVEVGLRRRDRVFFAGRERQDRLGRPGELRLGVVREGDRERTARSGARATYSTTSGVRPDCERPITIDPARSSLLS